MRLELLKKFLCGGGWGVVHEPILVFSLNLSQPEQNTITQVFKQGLESFNHYFQMTISVI